MAAAEQLSTTVSTKGQVILPKPIRDALHWDAGTRLIVELSADGVQLRPAPVFATAEIADVFGCLRYNGPAKSLDEMDAAIDAEIRRRHAGG